MSSVFGGGSDIDFKMPEYLKGATVGLGKGVEDLLGSLKFKPYNKQRVADLSGTQTGAMSSLEELLGSQRSGQTGLLEYLKGQGGVGAFMDPYLDEALAPVLRGIDEDTNTQMQGWDAKANMAGAFGDTGHALMGSEIERYGGQRKDDARGRAYSEAYNSALGIGEQDLSRMMEGENQTASFLNQLFGYGDVERATSQAELDTQYEEFLRSIGFDVDKLANLTNITAAIPFPASNATAQGSTAGGVGSILGGIGSVISSI